MSKTVYLISGATRGIGLGLTTALASGTNTEIYAGARDPSNAKALQTLARSHVNVHVVELTPADESDNRAVVAQIEAEQGQLNVVIANAGIGNHYGPLASTPLSQFREHWEVNTLGVVVLFQAAADLLLAKASVAPKFVVFSASVASMTHFFNLNAAAYGSSKAAVNFIVNAAHAENEESKLAAVAVNPGWVQTDMGNVGAKANGLGSAPVTLTRSVEEIIRIVQTVDRQNKAQFLDYSNATTVGC